MYACVGLRVCAVLQIAGCCQKVYVAEQLTYKRCEYNKKIRFKFESQIEIEN